MPPDIAGAKERIPGVFLDIGGQVHSVKHPNYGAVGDGVANDTAAIQAAIAAVAAKGGVVYFPQGIYGVSADIDIPPGVTLAGVNPGGSRTAAATTRDLGSVIKWIGGGAPTSAVLTCNLTNAYGQVRGLRIQDLRVDANGQPIAMRLFGLGEGCTIRNVEAEHFASRGLVLSRAAAGVNCEGLQVEGLVLTGLGGSRALELSYCYGCVFDLSVRLSVGATTPLDRGVDIVEFVRGCNFAKLTTEDCSVAVDVGTGAGGDCKGNVWVALHAANPTVAPAAITVGLYTGTIAFLVRTNATANSNNAVLSLDTTTAFNRTFFEEASGHIETASFAVDFPGVFSAYSTVTGNTGSVSATASETLGFRGATGLDAVAAAGSPDTLTYRLRQVIAKLRKSVKQSVTSATWTSIAYDVEDLDTRGGWDAAAPTRYTFQDVGIYLALYHGGFDSFEDTTHRGHRVVATGATLYAGSQFGAREDQATAIAVVTCTTAGTDYIETQSYQNTGSAVGVTPGLVVIVLHYGA